MSGMNFHRLTGLQVCILLNEKANLAPVFERVLSELGCEGLIDLLVAVDGLASEPSAGTYPQRLPPQFPYPLPSHNRVHDWSNEGS